MFILLTFVTAWNSYYVLDHLFPGNGDPTSGKFEAYCSDTNVIYMVKREVVSVTDSECTTSIWNDLNSQCTRHSSCSVSILWATLIKQCRTLLNEQRGLQDFLRKGQIIFQYKCLPGLFINSEGHFTFIKFGINWLPDWLID